MSGLSTTITPFRRFTILPSKGSAKPVDIFPGRTIIVDPYFQGFLDRLGKSYELKYSLACSVVDVDDEDRDEDIARALHLQPHGLLGNQRNVCAVLKYLAWDLVYGKPPILSVPSGKESITLVLGFTADRVFYVKRWEEKLSELSLRSRLFGHPWPPDTARRVITFSA